MLTAWKPDSPKASAAARAIWALRSRGRLRTEDMAATVTYVAPTYEAEFGTTSGDGDKGAIPPKNAPEQGTKALIPSPRGRDSHVTGG
ncbi:hypothetical protein MCNF_39360 [Mycolicibacterium confluentis]|uniref:Uncharacterized protein n=1 Tax=Mycolicibacterium confluentis TaxID=28047 RepID=A0A7I7Y2U2_9MYCO|nr:hypothetical protein MCNF_39360 [Mycolicibacterium confluentis]